MRVVGDYKMNWTRKFILGAALFTLVIPSAALATQRQQRRWYRGNVDQILRRLEEDTDRFKSSLDSALDRSRLDGSNREDNINAFVGEFEDATDRLKDRYEDQGYAPGQMREVLTRAARIDQFMRRRRLGGRAESDWQRVRRDLNQLSKSYSVNWRW